ncbi:MAG: methyltransferase [archaeon]
METISEGSVQISIPAQPSSPKESEAFYNPEMKLNRDLSILVAQEFFKTRKAVSVCEPLSATGVRALRYAKEVLNTQVYAGDIRKTAVEILEKNIALNELENVQVFHSDACELLEKRKYDLIDLDPFGSPADFIDSALKGCKKNGLLGITATDTRALCGAAPPAGTPMVKYNDATTLKCEYVHEIAIRILLGLIAQKSENGITPLLSLSNRHYLRVFVKPTGTKELGYVNHCFKCGARSVSAQKKIKCKCGTAFKHAGRLWIGKLWDYVFLNKLNTEDKELSKILVFMKAEAEGKPLFYTTRELYKEIPKLEVVLKEHKATRTHFKLDGIRIK